MMDAAPILSAASERTSPVQLRRFEGISTVGIRVGTNIATLLASIPITRALGPEGRGLYALALTLALIAQAMADGGAAASSWQWRIRSRPIHLVYGTANAIWTAVAIGLVLALFAISHLVLWHAPLLAAALVVPPILYCGINNGFVLANGNVAVTNVQYILTRAGPVLGALTVTIVAQKLYLVFGLWLVGYYLAAGYTALQLRQYVSLSEIRIDREVAAEHFRFCLSSSSVRLLDLLNTRIDMLLVLGFLGAAALGIYSVAVGFGESLWHVSRNLALSAYGRMAQSTIEESQALAVCFMKRVALGVAACTVAGFVAAPTLFVLMYGQRFAAAVTPFRIILLGCAVWSIVPILELFFTMRLGRPGYALRVQALSAALCAIITTLLISRFGIVGGALGSCIAYASGALTFLAMFRRARIARTWI